MSIDSTYMTPQTITKLYGISSNTLRNWAEAGKIKFIRPLAGRRLYNRDDVNSIFQQEKSPEKINKVRILYARVSSQHQSEDLSYNLNILMI